MALQRTITQGAADPEDEEEIAKEKKHE